MQNRARSRILVVDDEPQITRVLKSSLAANGYEVETAQDAAIALEKLMAAPPDLVITDLVMPGMDGVALCRQIRTCSNVPILILSVRDHEAAKIKALDAGADDYVTKPFSIQELLARVRAHLRREKTSETDEEPDLLAVGDFRIDRQAHKVEVRGQGVHLSPKEFNLLVFMAQQPGRVLTHRRLLTAIWGQRSADQPESLRVLIAQLRKKIERGAEPQYILNEPWVGYRFQPGGAE